MATMKDIAREAGVSHGTVSNVLNKTGKVSVEKIRLVEEAAKRLGYVPNTQAQILRQGAPTSVAIILPSLREEGFLDFYTALEQSLVQLGYSTTIHTTDDIPSKEIEILEKLNISNIAAIVTASCLTEECLQRYNSVPCPVVFVDRKPALARPGDSFFGFDVISVAKELSQYILANKWSNVAVFGSTNSFHPDRVLRKTMEAELKNHNVSLSSFSADLTLPLNKAFDIVQSGIDFDAIITSSSQRAEAMSTALGLSHYDPQPSIITLGSFRTYHSAANKTYELDYSQMGAKVAQAMTAFLTEKVPLPPEVLLRGKGFPLTFSNLQSCADETITMLTLDNPSTNALKKLLPMFKAITGITVKIVCIPYDDLHVQVGSFSEHFHYDLVRMDVAKFDSLGEKTYLPLQEAGITQDLLHQKLIQSGYDSYSQLSGVRYALPFDPSVQLFLYRTDLFEDAKLRRAYYEKFHEQLTIPTSIEQYLRIAQFFTKSENPDSPTHFGATITDATASSAASDFLPYYLEKVSGLQDQNGCVTLDNPQMIQAMEQYRSMMKYASKQPWWNDSIQAFADGHVATTVVYSNYASSIVSSSHSNIAGKVGAAVTPGGTPLLGGGVIGICKYSKKIEACKQFFQWYYTPDIASLLVRLGGTSPLVDAYNDYRNFSIFPWLPASKASFSLGTRGIGNANVPGFSIQKYEFAIGSAIRSLTNQISTPVEAAAMAQAIYQSS